MTWAEEEEAVGARHRQADPGPAGRKARYHRRREVPFRMSRRVARDDSYDDEIDRLFFPPPQCPIGWHVDPSAAPLDLGFALHRLSSCLPLCLSLGCVGPRDCGDPRGAGPRDCGDPRFDGDPDYGDLRDDDDDLDLGDGSHCDDGRHGGAALRGVVVVFRRDFGRDVFRLCPLLADDDDLFDRLHPWTHAIDGRPFVFDRPSAVDRSKHPLRCALLSPRCLSARLDDDDPISVLPKNHRRRPLVLRWLSSGARPRRGNRCRRRDFRRSWPPR